MRRPLAAGLLLIILIYGGAITYLIAEETAIVFQSGAPLGPLRPTAPFEQVELSRSDGTKQLIWVMPHGGASEAYPWLIFLHGNGAPISARLNILHYERLRQLRL